MWKKTVKNYLSYLIPLLSTEKGLWWMDLHFKSLDPWQLLQNPCLHPENKKLDFSQFLGPRHNGGAPQQSNRNTNTNTNTNKKTNVCMLRTRNRISVNFWELCTVEVHLHICCFFISGWNCIFEEHFIINDCAPNKVLFPFLQFI